MSPPSSEIPPPPRGEHPAVGRRRQQLDRLRRHYGLRVVVPLCLLALAVSLALATRRLEARSAVMEPITATVPFRAIEPLVRAQRGAAPAQPVPMPIGFRLAPGETLGGALGELGVEAAEIHAVAGALAGVVNPRSLRPADGYSAYFDGRSRLVALEVKVAGRGRAELSRVGEEWRSSWWPSERRVEWRQVHGQVESALESAIVEAGGDAAVAYRMADVLQWDLDFNRDLRRGDTFDVLYEAVFLDDRFQQVGDILALRYRHQGFWLAAYRFGDEGGYYDGEGRPVRKMFLRSPVAYSRITSGFSNRRFHPVLKRYLPHYGVDFGAPAGTPVRATATGTVQSAGWNNGGGNTVKIRHPNGYLTAYLHLSRFGSGVSAGARVRQGQVIGYVGSTGLATAPHLDYRVQQNGHWINPMSLRSQPADPVPVDELGRFHRWRDAYRVALVEGGPFVPPAAGAGRTAITTAERRDAERPLSDATAIGR